MSKRAKKFSGYISAGVLICFFVLINLTFGNHILANEKTEQSGKEYTEREEFIFSDIFQSEEDYIEQKFIPQREGLDQIKIRLAINYAGLPDEMVVKIDLCQEDRVIQSEEIDKEQIRNWHYYDYNIKEKLAPGEEYTVRISQPIGPEDEKDGKYWVSYVIFHAAEHVEENAESYFYNGEEVKGEFELCYIYHYIDQGLVTAWVVTDAVFAAAAAALMVMRKHVKIKEKNKKRICAFLYFILPVFGFISVEQIAGNLLTMQLWSVIKNLLFSYLIFFLLSFVFRRIGTLAIVYMAGCAVLGLVQYFVLLFRGSAFTIQDFFAWKTAATVANKYIYEITFPIFLNLILFLFLVCTCMQVKRTVFSVRHKFVFVLSAVGVMGMAGSLSGGFLISTHLINTWDLAASYRKYGVVLTLASEVQYLVGEKPEGYSVEKVESILADMDSRTENETIVPDNIILIMNESFADLEYIQEIATDTELLPYLRGMKENVVKGYLTVPVFGGGTSNSEYEVLTGNSMAFLSGGSPYQTNVSAPEYGLAYTLKSQGYYTAAAHPYLAENWNRRKVYSDMGFDIFISEENWGKENLMRWCESDKGAYDKIISLYEETEGKFFAFLVTMQNHGGYGEEFDNFQNTVKLNYAESYPQAEQYLSLLQESDKAFAELISHFEDVEEPTMIVMFGDHQATLENEFYEELFGMPKEELGLELVHKRYATPFVIWTNYDIEEKYDVMMSSNYFGSYILNIAGVELTPYNRFQLKALEEVPIISGRGVCDSEGKWYAWEEAPGACIEFTDAYRILQYNNIYDRKNRVDSFFSVASGG